MSQSQLIKVFFLFVIAFGGSALAWKMQSVLGGTAPKMSYEEYRKLRGLPADPEEPKVDLMALRREVENNPEDPSAVSALGDALYKLAEQRFLEKRFSEAAAYYQEQLAVQPEKNFVRGRYASTLIFLSRVNEAIQELKKVLADDPEDFHANAFLAIAYGEKGEKQKAIDQGGRAVAFAPSDEAKARFESFLESIRQQPEGETARNLQKFLEGNSVAGPKFVKLEEEENTLKAYFKDFPMEQMPEFAKEKFFSGIQQVLRSDREITVKFIDLDSGRTMEVFSNINE